MQSKQRRAGSAVLHACGPHQKGGGLHVGLLFVSAELAAGAYDLFDVETNEQARVALPADLSELRADKCVRNATLEVT